MPDVYIHKVGDEYVTTLNDDGMPKLKISSYYRRLMSAKDGNMNAEAKGYIQGEAEERRMVHQERASEAAYHIQGRRVYSEVSERISGQGASIPKAACS